MFLHTNCMDGHKNLKHTDWGKACLAVLSHDKHEIKLLTVYCSAISGMSLKYTAPLLLNREPLTFY